MAERCHVGVPAGVGAASRRAAVTQGATAGWPVVAPDGKNAGFLGPISFEAARGRLNQRHTRLRLTLRVRRVLRVHTADWDLACPISSGGMANGDYEDLDTQRPCVAASLPSKWQVA